GSLVALAWVYPMVIDDLVVPGAPGLGPAVESVVDSAPAIARLLLALALPPLLALLLGEYFIRPLHREHGMEAAVRRVAAREEAGMGDGDDETPPAQEPDVRWQTTYAPVWRRAAAFVLDGLICFALLFLAMTIAAIAEGTPADVPMTDEW